MLIDISFDYVIAIIIVLSMLTQILFGVGILIWGTPSLILLGYEFDTALSLLLPISIGVSGLQTSENFKHINRKGIWKFIKFSLPFVIIGLVFILTSDFNVEWLVFGALAVGGVLRLSVFQRFSDNISKFKDIMLPFIGIVHGISNLGGALLVLWVSHTDKTKLGFRTTVAACYFLLGIFQIVTLMLYEDEIFFFLSYFIFGILSYLILHRVILKSTNDTAFDMLLTALIFGMAFLMGLKVASII